MSTPQTGGEELAQVVQEVRCTSARKWPVGKELAAERLPWCHVASRLLNHTPQTTTVCRPAR